jgi:ATP-dependent helicase YprA (DUF1998 family)
VESVSSSEPSGRAGEYPGHRHYQLLDVGVHVVPTTRPGFLRAALRYVVLDEAHLYTGTLAAEITLLLRRVKDRCQVSPRRITHIATSATLGGTEADLKKFAATVFSIPQALIEVFQGTQAPLSSWTEPEAAKVYRTLASWTHFPG